MKQSKKWVLAAVAGGAGAVLGIPAVGVILLALGDQWSPLPAVAFVAGTFTALAVARWMRRVPRLGMDLVAWFLTTSVVWWLVLNLSGVTHGDQPVSDVMIAIALAVFVCTSSLVSVAVVRIAEMTARGPARERSRP